MMRIFILLLLLLTSQGAMAQDSWLNFDWTSHEKDRSIYYLGQIFGQVGTVLLGQGGPLVGDLFRIFNIVVLTLGTIVVIYSTVLTTISTAQEGEVMGKKWSSIWIPIRSATGLAVLLPTGSGYSLIQILMMWIILQGIHGANKIWQVVIDQAATGQGISSSTKVDEDSLYTTARGAFQAAICMEKINNNPQYLNQIGGNPVTVYQDGNYLKVGVNELNSPYSSVCGYFTRSQATKPANVASQAEWNRTQYNAAELGVLVLNPYARELNDYPTDSSQWSGLAVLTSAARAIRGPVAQVELSGDTDEDFQTYLTYASEDGWIHAGNYYFKLINPEGGAALSALTLFPPVYNPPSNPNAVLNWTAQVEQPMNQYIAFSSGTSEGGSTPDFSLSPPVELSDDLEELAGNASSGFSSLMRTFMDHLSNRDDDPIVSFQQTGSEILISTEVLLFVLIIASLVAITIACIMSGFQPACYIVGTAIVILLPIFMVILGLVWTAGVAIGIYLPLVPYLVFTFTALGWLLLCVETIVAAPIVALGITAPGQDYLGKATPAVLLITNVFLRPSLMVIGFIAAARLVGPAIQMINYGFEAFVILNVGVLLLFGNIALIVIYAGVCLAVIHQIFSLIHILPEKVIRWIGGQAEQGMVETAMQEAKKASESAAQTTQAVMKGVTEAVTKGAEKASDKSEEKKEDKKKDDGGDGGGKGGDLQTGQQPPGGGGAPGGGAPGGAGGGAGAGGGGLAG